MQVGLAEPDVVSIVSSDGKYTAKFLADDNSWMSGAIAGKQFADDTERRAYVQQVLDCIEQVGEPDLPYSTCTDGRKRVQLANGQPVPLREQLVGTDTMCAFVAAGALGSHFYGDDLYKPVDVRIRKVVQYLLDNKYRPTAHIACGAAGGFTTVINRATQFIKEPAYISRLAKLADNNYNDTLHYLIVGSYQSRIDSGVFDGYRDGLVAEIVQEMVGPEAVEHYDDDGRGVHGHREQLIVYLDQSMQGLVLNPNKLIAATDSQVFGVNSSRIDALARLMSGEDQHGINYLTARLAIEDFSCAGHGTLAHGMETVVITRNA
jgi:hypothetical protein